MKTRSYIFWALLATVLIAFILRVYNITKIPPSLSWDEVSIGYNAYSILKTGRDEHQKFLPLDAFAAYGDYKPPIPIYLTVPSVALFGLNEFSVRTPSVIFGTLTVLFIFFLVKQLLPDKTDIALLSSVLFAFSPWHIQLSRAGFEANIALFFIVFGALLALLARYNIKLLYFCWLPFVAAVYTFNSARYFVPFLTLGLLVYCWKSFRFHKTTLFIGIVISATLLIPIVPHLLSKEARLRFNEVNIFSDISFVKISNERISYDNNLWWAKVLHNRRIEYGRSYLVHFSENLEPWFLFIRGDGNPKFSIQDVGQLYLVDLPFVVYGIYWIFSKESSVAWLLVFWLISAIIPAATARETPHALRIENSLPVFIIFLASGLSSLIKIWNVKRLGKLFIVLILFLYTANVLYYLHNYYIHYAREYSGEWQYGYREALYSIKSRQSEYDNIIITDSIGRPYMYVLFYEEYDPALYWKSVKASFDAAGFYNVYSFDKYHFVRGGVNEFSKKTLYIMDPNNVPANARVLDTIKQLNGKPILVVFDTP